MGRVLTLFCLLASSAVTPSVLASDEMPEVLRYARQYSRENPESMQRAALRPPKEAVGAGLTRRLARSELIRRQQQAQLQALEKKLRTLETERTRSQSVSVPGDCEALQSVTTRADGLSRDLAVATEKQAALTKQVAELEREKTTLLTASSVDRRAQRVAQQKADAALKEKTEELTRQVADLAAIRKQVEALTAENSTLTKQVISLQKQASVQGDVLLKTPRQQQAYAAGVMYARDVREAREGNRLLGVDLDLKALMAGLNDALQGKMLSLAPTALDMATLELEKAAGDGYARVTKAQAAQASAWLNKFRKEKGTEKDESGFWYRVTYAGDGELLMPEDTVDVVVEESLTNGQVVSDMDRAGSSLRQKVSEFPPVFAAGLQRLKNHGQITLMVPPELAYGDKGYPPEVPPGATMIYRIRVSDKIPAGASVTRGSKQKLVGRRAK